MLAETVVLIVLSRSFSRRNVYVVEQGGTPMGIFSLFLDGEKSDIRPGTARAACGLCAPALCEKGP